MSMPLSFSAVRAPPQSSVNVSCSQIEAGCLAGSSARAPATVNKAAAAAPAKSPRRIAVASGFRMMTRPL